MMPQGGLLPNVGTQLYAAGWGMTEENGDISMTLKEVAVPLVNLDICNDADSYEGYVKEESMFCAGYADGGIDACQGDSGGPIVELNPAGTAARLVGIISWGKGCGRANYYGVYTKISSVNDWIHRTVQRLSGEVVQTTTAPVTTTQAPGGNYFQGLEYVQCNSFLDAEPVEEADDDRTGMWDMFETTEDDLKIVGGSVVLDREHWPWMVNFGNQCGASLVGKEWVLTAAHCCSPETKPLTKSVYMGHSWWQRSSFERGRSGIHCKCQKWNTL